MTAHVIDLDSRRRVLPTPGCACRAGSQCYPHQLEDLLARLRVELLRADGLLVPRDHLERAVADAEHVIGRIADECRVPRARGRVGTPGNPNQEHA